MAKSDYIRRKAKFGYIQLSWSIVSQSIENNTSTLKYTLSIYRNSKWSSEIGKDYWIKIDGKTVDKGTNILGGAAGTTTLRTGTVVLEHLDDGTRSVEMGFSQLCDITWSGTHIDTLTGTETFQIDDVPRPTTPTVSETTLEMDSVHTISLPRKKTSFTHNLTVKFGEIEISIATDAEETFDWEPLSEDFASAIPEAVSGAATISCETFNEGVSIGVRTIEVILSIPSNVTPVFTGGIIVNETVYDTYEKFNAYVQNVSKPKIEVFAEGIYGSSIVGYEIEFDGRKYNEQSVTCEKIWQSGQLRVHAIVKDTRGRRKEAWTYIEVLPYFSPTISTFTAVRCTGDKIENPEGTRLYVNFVFQINPLNNLNNKRYALEYNETGSEGWTTIVEGNTYSENYDGVVSASHFFDIDKTYKVKLTLEDYFSTTEKIIELATAFTIVDFNQSGKGIAFGKVSEHDYMEIGMPVRFTKGIVEDEPNVPVFENGWHNYGNEYDEVKFFKSFDGIVRVSGFVTGPTDDAESVIFVLPEGYRPQRTERFICASTASVCMVDVRSTGEVAIPFAITEDAISLSGIAFKQFY